MFRWTGKMGLNAKIAFLGILSVLITVGALLTLAFWQSGQYNQLAQGEVDRLISADLDHIALGTYNLVQAENEAVQEQVDGNLNVVDHILKNAGGVTLSPESVTWTGINQYTQKELTAKLPKILVGDKWLGQNSKPTVNTPVVDEATSLVGGTATIFQRINERGDMLRIATNVPNKDGQRAIGTYIPAVNPDNTPNPVVSTIMKGELYHGRAFVVDAWYITAYAPLLDDEGNLVGMTYAGIKQKQTEARIRQAVLQTKVGETGYVYVLSGQGKGRGSYIISQKGTRDGEDIWEAKDSHGNYMVQDIIKKAIALKPGELGTIRYLWENPGDPHPRWKIARLAYYKPWDWVIGASTYEDELQTYRAVLGEGRTHMTNIMGIAGLVCTFFVGLLGVLMAWTITRPVREMTQAVETITQGHGNLDQRVEVHSTDEIGTLAEAFNMMTSRLKQTIEGLCTSEEKYRQIFEFTIEGLFQTTQDGLFLSASPSMARILGYDTPQELIYSITSLRDQVYVHPEERDELIRLVIESDCPVTKESELYRKDGQKIWALISIRAVRDDQGRFLFTQGFVTDITERKKSESDLHRFRFMVENAKQEIYLATPDGGLAYVNHAAADSLGYTVEEMMAMGVPGFDPAFKEGFHAYFLKLKEYDALNDYKRPPLETTHITKDGRSLIKEVEAVYLPIDGKEYICGFGTDITERKRAEEELRRITKQQSVILENSTLGIALVRNRKFEWVNPRMPELFGVSAEEFQGAPTRIIYPDEKSYEKVGTKAYSLLGKGEKAALEIEMLKADGSLFWCRLEGKALDASNPQEGSIWIWEDVTERKRTEEALAKRIVALTQPLDSSGGISFDDLFDLEDIQRIQDEFAEATGVAAIMTTPDGTPITKPSRFCKLCDLTRQTPKGMANCHRSDSELGRCHDGPTISPCLSGGLWDAGASIHVGGQYVANWLIGQVRDSTQTEEGMRKYAREIGIEEDVFVEAFNEVPSMSREQFEEIAQLLYTIASQLSAMAFQNVQQSRFIADRQQAEERIKKLNEDLEQRVVQRTAQLENVNQDLTKEIAERIQAEEALKERLKFENMIAEISSDFAVRSTDQIDQSITRALNEVGKFAEADRTYVVLLAEDFQNMSLSHEWCAQGIVSHIEQWKNTPMPALEWVREKLEKLEPFRVTTLTDLLAEAFQEKCVSQDETTGSCVVVPLVCGGILKGFLGLDAVRPEWRCSDNSLGLLKTATRSFANALENKWAEEKRLDLELQLLHAQKLESVGQLAAGIAHEINTPTQFVGDNIHFLEDAFTDLASLIDSFDRLEVAVRKDNTKPDLLSEIEQVKETADIDFLREEIPNAIEHSLDGVQRIAKIVYAMKTFSYPDVNEKAATDLNRAIETTVTVARNEWKYVADVDLQLDPTLPAIACFPGEINQVILNLIVNASHAITEKNGAGSAEMGTITISTKMDGDMAEIRVTDTGTGIPEEYRKRMFTPFFTTKSVGKGTGQGLAMAFNIVHKKHGGTITFETESGVGTTFTIRLPYEDTEDVTAEAEVEPAQV